jgi:hypothetical protein
MVLGFGMPFKRKTCGEIFSGAKQKDAHAAETHPKE